MDAVCTRLQVIVGSNVHLIVGKPITKKIVWLELEFKCSKDGGEKLTIKLKKLQIEKLPQTNDEKTWTKFNDRLNELANQGYTVLRATEIYILLSRKANAIRREE